MFEEGHDLSYGYKIVGSPGWTSGMIGEEVLKRIDSDASNFLRVYHVLKPTSYCYSEQTLTQPSKVHTTTLLRIEFKRVLEGYHGRYTKNKKE